MTDQPRHYVKISSMYVSGWALDPQHIDRTVTLKVFVDSKLVRIISASRPRSSLKRKYGGRGRHGFVVMLPLVYYDAYSRKLRLERTDTAESIFEGDVAFNDLRWRFGDSPAWAFVEPGRTGVRGWILDPEAADHGCSLQLWCDGQRRIEVPADEPSDLLPFDEPSQRQHGFSVGYPDDLFDDAAHVFELRVGGERETVLRSWSSTLPASERRNAKGQFEVSELTIKGIVKVPDGAEDHSACVQLFSGSEPLRTFRALPERPFAVQVFDVKERLIVSGRLGATIDGGAERQLIRGEDPFLNWLSLEEAEWCGSLLHLTLKTTLNAPHSIYLKVITDGHVQSHSLEARGGYVSLELRPPETWRSIDIGLEDEDEPLSSLRLRARLPRGPAPSSANSYVEPTSAAARQALVLLKAGINRLPTGAGYTGDWQLDAATARIAGWVILIEAPLSPLEIRLLVDGQPVAVTRSGDIACESGAMPINFTFDLSNVTRRSPYSLVRVEVVGAGILGPERRLVADSQSSVVVEHLIWGDFVLEASGFVDPVEAAAEFYVGLFLDGALVAKARCAPIDGICRFKLRHLVGPEGLERLAVRALKPGARDAALPPLIKNYPSDLATSNVSVEDEETDCIIGAVEAANGVVSGWITAGSPPVRSPRILVSVDGEPLLTSARSERRDAEPTQSAPGDHRFVIELPPNLGWTSAHEIRLDIAGAVSPIPSRGVVVPARQPCVEPSRLSVAVEPVHRADRRALPIALSVVVRSRGDGAALARLFESAVQHELESNAEWIVIDAPATEEAARACTRARMAGLKLRYVPITHALLAGALNNLGVRLARSQEVVFMNSSIVLLEPILESMVRALDDPTLGIIGMRLHEASIAQPFGEGPVQHLGTFMSPLSGGGLRPFSGRVVPETLHLMDKACAVPAVSGALCAVRKLDVLQAGGFSDYHGEGFAEVDLALELGQINKRAASLNDVRAVNMQDSPLSDAEFPVQRDSYRLTRRWSRYLRRKIRADLLSRPGFWSGMRPTIGIAVDPHDNDRCPQAAGALISLIQKQVPAHVRLLDPSAWTDLSGIDILVALAPDFDPRSIRQARPILQVGALVSSATATRWQQRLAGDAALTAAGFDAVCTVDDARSADAVAKVWSMFDESGKKLKFAIKTPALRGQEASWGDYHFAESLAAAIRSLGHLCRVDLRDEWYGGLAETDDVVILLRGRSAYKPYPHQCNLMWFISHPDDVSARELNAYDQVFVASEAYAPLLQRLTDTPVEVLLQCTDPDRFNLDLEKCSMPRTEVLFVGNSRGVFRDAVRWALDAELRLSVYGDGWDGHLPSDILKGRYVPNEILGGLYGASDVVICDHWEEMRRHGFISNRVFDVLASGGRVLVDDVDGLTSVFSNGEVEIYRSKEDLARLCALKRDPELRSAVASEVIQNHSFLERARRIIDVAADLVT